MLPCQSFHAYVGSTLRSMEEVVSSGPSSTVAYIVFSGQVSSSPFHHYFFFLILQTWAPYINFQQIQNRYCSIGGCNIGKHRERGLCQHFCTFELPAWVALVSWYIVTPSVSKSQNCTHSDTIFKGLSLDMLVCMVISEMQITQRYQWWKKICGLVSELKIDNKT